MKNKSSKEPSLVEMETRPDPHGPRFLTASQSRALTELVAMARLSGHQESYGGFRVRTKPLLYGVSGSGKTALCTRLCETLSSDHEDQKCELHIVNASSFTICGSRHEPCTLHVIRRFVRRLRNKGDGHRLSGIILLDELDKCVGVSDSGNSSWDQSVTGELLALLDADLKLTTAGWNQADIQFLRSSVLVVGAGAWQQQARKAEENNISHGKAILDDLKIPEELAYRFNPRIIHISPPTEGDFRAAILRIHEDLGLPKLDSSTLEGLVKHAMEAKCGLRVIEQMLTDLLAANPHLRRKEEPLAKIEDEKNVVSASVFQAETANAFRLMEHAESSLALLRVQMRLIVPQIIKPADPTDLNLENRMTAEKLEELFENTLLGLRFRYAHTNAQRELRHQFILSCGRDLVDFIDLVIKTHVDLLAKQDQILRLLVTVQNSLSLALTAWVYLNTLIDD